jgi:hypothetical protein
VRRVQVEWVDSVSDDGWVVREDAVTRAAKEGMLDCVSVGMLLDETEEYVLLATSHMRDGDLVQGCLQIPRAAVLSVKELRR